MLFIVPSKNLLAEVIKIPDYNLRYKTACIAINVEVWVFILFTVFSHKQGAEQSDKGQSEEI